MLQQKPFHETLNFFVERETYNWFSHSSNRRHYYRNLFQTINGGVNPLTIPQVCNTRWISIEPAVCRILEQWIELKTLFEVARRDENCYTAEILYNMYNDPQNHLYLLYIKPKFKRSTSYLKVTMLTQQNYTMI